MSTVLIFSLNGTWVLRSRWPWITLNYSKRSKDLGRTILWWCHGSQDLSGFCSHLLSWTLSTQPYCWVLAGCRLGARYYSRYKNYGECLCSVPGTVLSSGQCHFPRRTAVWRLGLGQVFPWREQCAWCHSHVLKGAWIWLGLRCDWLAWFHAQSDMGRWDTLGDVDHSLVVN